MIDISLEGIEDVFRICGWHTGKAALEQRIHEYVEANDQRIQGFLKAMERYDKPRLQGAPCTAKNLPREDLPGLNYFAPMKILQVTLAKEWFDQASTDRERFTQAWRGQLVTDLLASEYRDELARTWQKADQRLQVKGRVMGALIAAGVLRKSALHVARIYYGTGEENTAEVKTLAKYMGDCRKEHYTGWIKEYVESQSKNTR